MQTVINKDMAVGIPGTHGNGQPYYADPYIAGGEVTFGTLAGIDASGNVVAWASGACAGLIVNPNEHVVMALPSDTRTLKVGAGTTVALAKKGSWYVAVPSDETERAKWIKGAKLKADTTTHALAVDDAGTYGEILMVGGGVALVRLV